MDIIQRLKRKQLVSGLTRPPGARRGQHGDSLPGRLVLCGYVGCIRFFAFRERRPSPRHFSEVFEDRNPESFAQ